MLDNKIPKAEYGIVGGSGTLSSDFPNNIQAEDTKLQSNSKLRKQQLLHIKASFSS